MHGKSSTCIGNSKVEMHEVNVPYTLVYVNYGTSKRHHHSTVIKHIILSVCDFNSCGHCMVDFLRKCST